jgi:hypothetical protein
MKYLFIILLFPIIGFFAKKKNSNRVVYYSSVYISNDGNDANIGSISEPIQSINKLNSMNLSSGADIYFAKNDTFVGEFRLNATGTSVDHINITSYGSGANPVITGLDTVNNTFTEVSTNLWKANVNYEIGENDTMINTIHGNLTYAVRPNFIQFVQKNDTFCEVSLSNKMAAVVIKNGNIWMKNSDFTGDLTG